MAERTHGRTRTATHFATSFICAGARAVRTLEKLNSRARSFFLVGHACVPHNIKWPSLLDVKVFRRGDISVHTGSTGPAVNAGLSYSMLACLNVRASMYINAHEQMVFPSVIISCESLYNIYSVSKQWNVSAGHYKNDLIQSPHAQYTHKNAPKEFHHHKAPQIDTEKEGHTSKYSRRMFCDVVVHAVSRR